MPNDTINNAIKKASGATDTSNYEEITYEGYGTNGVAVIVEASTDNRNTIVTMRTVSGCINSFSKTGHLARIAGQFFLCFTKFIF